MLANKSFLESSSAACKQTREEGGIEELLGEEPFSHMCSFQESTHIIQSGLSLLLFSHALHRGTLCWECAVTGKNITEWHLVKTKSIM